MSHYILRNTLYLSTTLLSDNQTQYPTSTGWTLFIFTSSSSKHLDANGARPNNVS